MSTPQGQAAELSKLTGRQWPSIPDPAVTTALDRSGGKADDPLSGRPVASNTNIKRAFQFDQRLSNFWIYDDFQDRILLGDAELNDALAVEVQIWLDVLYKLRIRFESVHTVGMAMAKANTVDPLAAYLNGLQGQWDGQTRIETFLSDYLGAEDTPVNRTLSTNWFKAAAKRGLEPGVKMDTMLVLTGNQGEGKSRSLAALCPDEDWFSDSSLDLQSKDRFVGIQGCWLYEMSELDGMRKADRDRVKAFVSSRVDSYRPPYGRVNVRRPRRTVFVGTTNEDRFLEDPTGSRRFWPVAVGTCRPPDIAAVRDQLWAEALVLLAQQDTWWLDRTESVELAQASTRFEDDDSWTDGVVRWIVSRKGEAFTMAEVLAGAIGLDTKAQTSGNGRRMAKILRRLGLTRKQDSKRDPLGRRQKRWYIPENCTLLNPAGDVLPFPGAPPPPPVQGNG